MLGQIEAILKKVVHTCDDRKGQLYKVLSGTIKLIVRIISPLIITRKQTIDYSRSVVDSVKAGQYDWSENDITDQNFPSDEQGIREVEFVLFRYKGKMMTPDNVIPQMEVEGIRPATLKELLAYGEQNPNAQRSLLIIALGSVSVKVRFYNLLIRNNPFFALNPSLAARGNLVCLGEHDSNRRVELIHYYGGWYHDGCRFLGVRT